MLKPRNEIWYKMHSIVFKFNVLLPGNAEQQKKEDEVASYFIHVIQATSILLVYYVLRSTLCKWRE